MPSAVIAAYAYDAIKETLIIRYHSGKVYNYLNVPEKVFKEMRSTMVKEFGSTAISKANTNSRKSHPV